MNRRRTHLQTDDSVYYHSNFHQRQQFLSHSKNAYKQKCLPQNPSTRIFINAFEHLYHSNIEVGIDVWLLYKHEYCKCTHYPYRKSTLQFWGSLFGFLKCIIDNSLVCVYIACTSSCISVCVSSVVVCTNICFNFNFTVGNIVKNFCWIKHC